MIIEGEYDVNNYEENQGDYHGVKQWGKVGIKTCLNFCFLGGASREC